jgi:glycosyltransferase involved in cell wall biosynthesis
VKVSCIMPCSRNEDLPTAIEVFLSQNYPDKELIIGLDSLEGNDLSYLPEDAPVYTFFNGLKESIGSKRNHLVNSAKGEIISHADSDDWYAPDYLRKAVAHLIATKSNIVGLSKAYFYRHPSNLWLYQAPGGMPYVIGSGMTYYKTVWEKKPFDNVNSGEDLNFQTNSGKIAPLDYIDGFMAMIHDKNTASHKSLFQMKRMNPDIAHSILGESYYLYTK